MCILITATLPKSVDWASLKNIIDKYELSLEPIQNEYLTKQMKENERYVKATRSGCDCNTGLNSSRLFHKKPNPSGLKKLGKTQAKEFLKWLDERNRKLIDDAQRWKNIIDELLSIEGISNFGLLIHFYNSGLNENGEQFEIKRMEYKNYKDVTIDYLTEMEENVLYEFIKD